MSKWGKYAQYFITTALSGNGSLYSGKILDVDDPAIGTVGEVFTHWQWPLHSGQVFGWTGRILVFLAGLTCPALYITGVIRWLQKRKAKRLQKIQQTKN